VHVRGPVTGLRRATRGVCAGILVTVSCVLVVGVPAGDAVPTHSFRSLSGCVSEEGAILRIERRGALCTTRERLLRWPAGTTEWPRTLIYSCVTRRSGALRHVRTWSSCRSTELRYRWQGFAHRAPEHDIHSCVHRRTGRFRIISPRTSIGPVCATSSSCSG